MNMSLQQQYSLPSDTKKKIRTVQRYGLPYILLPIDCCRCARCLGYSIFDVTLYHEQFKVIHQSLVSFTSTI